MDYVPSPVEYNQDYNAMAWEVVERDPRVTEAFLSVFLLLKQMDLTDDQRMSVFTRLMLNEMDRLCKTPKQALRLSEDMYQHFTHEHEKRAEERVGLDLP